MSDLNLDKQKRMRKQSDFAFEIKYSSPYSNWNGIWSEWQTVAAKTNKQMFLSFFITNDFSCSSTSHHILRYKQTLKRDGSHVSEHSTAHSHLQREQDATCRLPNAPTVHMQALTHICTHTHSNTTQLSSVLLTRSMLNMLSCFSQAILCENDKDSFQRGDSATVISLGIDLAIEQFHPGSCIRPDIQTVDRFFHSYCQGTFNSCKKILVGRIFI